MNLISGQSEYIPFPDILVAGFSCVSRCKMNNNRAQFKNCVAAAEAGGCQMGV